MSFHKTIFGKPNNARKIEKTGTVQPTANNSMQFDDTEKENNEHGKSDQ